MIGDIKVLLSLAYWFGPFCPEDSRPTSLTKKEVEVSCGDRVIKAWVYIPRGAIRGIYLISPGFHFQGPSDPRFIRFNSILASAGFLIMAPFIEDYINMKLLPTAEVDFRACFDYLESMEERPPEIKPGIFSVSFGSLLAMRLAGHKDYKERVGGLIIFGGYADWDETLRFFLTGLLNGEMVAKRDPLCRPVVFLNLLDCIQPEPKDPEKLIHAWKEYIQTSWPGSFYLERKNYEALAYKISEKLEGRDKELFIQGCVFNDEGKKTGLEALDKMKEEWVYLDPLVWSSEVSCPVTVIHGRDDDVVPVNQAKRFEKALEHNDNVSICITGLFAHSKNEGKDSLYTKTALLVKEVTMLFKILKNFLIMGSQKGEK